MIAVWGESEGHLRERLAAFGCATEGQGEGEIQPLHEVLGVRERVDDDARELRARRSEAGGQGVAEGAGDPGRDDGRDHEGSPNPGPFSSRSSINLEASMLFSNTMSRNPGSGVLELAHPRGDVPLAVEHPPDVDVVIALDGEHQIRESFQPP